MNKEPNGKEVFEWPPLESDPMIFTNYMHKIGLSENFEFAELFSLDEEMLQIIDKPVYGVIVNYERGSTKREVDKSQVKLFENLFYMKQISQLDNACGIIAALHSIGSNLNDVLVNQNSILFKYLKEASHLDPVKRAELLDKCNDFKDCHTEYANQGQSKLCENQEEVKGHYVCFIYFNESVIELDGLLEGPVIISEKIKPEEFIFRTAKEIQKRLEEKNITENLSMIYLTKK